MIPATSDWIDRLPPWQRAAYCHAWHTSPRTWLTGTGPDRWRMRVTMNRMCRG